MWHNFFRQLLDADSKFGIHFLVARQILELQRKAILGILTVLC